MKKDSEKITEYEATEELFYGTINIFNWLVNYQDHLEVLAKQPTTSEETRYILKEIIQDFDEIYNETALAKDVLLGQVSIIDTNKLS